MFLRKLKRVFFADGGGLRVVWQLILLYAAYVAWAYSVTYLMSLGFSALFKAWNVNSANVALAPAWARFIFEHNGSFISIISSAGVITGAWLLLGRKLDKPNMGTFAGFTALGALMAALPAVLFLLIDSMRADIVSANAGLILFIPVLLLATLAEDLFARGLMFKLARGKRYLGYLLSAIMLTAVSGAIYLSALGIINMLLMNLMCCVLRERFGYAASVGTRFGWSFLASGIMRFPGSNLASSGMFVFFSVSEEWLTGGEAGLICGAFTTVILLAVICAFAVPDIRKLAGLKRDS